jgi:uncharacterized RDD family membrane protein YckC
MVSNNSQRFRSDNYLTVCGIVVLSLALAAGIVAVSWTYEISVGGLIDEQRDFRGVLKNDELWFTARHHEEFPFTLTPSYDYRIKRLNLHSGIIQATGFQTSKPLIGFWSHPVWIGETLYFCAGQTIFEAAERSLAELPSIPLFGDCLFDFDGVLTTLSTTSDGLRLAHWIENQWVFGRQVILPEVDRLWYHNQQHDRMELRPLTSKDPFEMPRTKALKRLFVEKQGSQYHLMLMDGIVSFAAYRSGFEFVDDDVDAASGLAPENSQRDVSGWEPVFPGQKGFHCAEMKCDLNGPLFVSTYPKHWVVRRLPDGTWTEVELGKEKEVANGGGLTIVTSPSNSDAYMITFDWWWSSANIFRIEGKSIHPVDFTVPGFKYVYLGRCVRLLAELLVAWTVHILVLRAGLRSFQQSLTSRWEFGCQAAALASMHQRLIALFVDVGLMYGVVWLVWCLWRLCLFPSEPLWKMISSGDIAPALRNFLYSLQTGGMEPLRILRTVFDSLAGWFIYPFDPTSDFLGALVATLLVLFGTKVFFEAQYGITPGKWLMGIRTVSSSLRPCGIGQALTRNILYAVDLPLFLTPIPACLSLMLSNHRQRLGDRVADTVVIRAGTIIKS